MEFEWDEDKRLKNLQQHHLDFLDAHEFFGGEIAEAADERYDYGEERYLGIGLLRGMAMVMVYSEPRPEVIRIISFRKATKHEREKFEAWLANRLGPPAGHE
jgi:uncharacterized DUF497 family protein